MTNHSPDPRAPDDQAVAAAVRRVWSAQEPDTAQVPSFRLTWDAAARRGERRARPLRWSLAAVASVAAVAVVMLWSVRSHAPTLQEDIELARTVSFESVWHSPSDQLLAQAPTAVMRDMPDMPQPGLPTLSEEYL